MTCGSLTPAPLLMPRFVGTCDPTTEGGIPIEKQTIQQETTQDNHLRVSVVVFCWFRLFCLRKNTKKEGHVRDRGAPTRAVSGRPAEYVEGTTDPQLMFIHIHQLFRILCTCFELDAVSIDWWTCINVCLLPEVQLQRHLERFQDLQGILPRPPQLGAGGAHGLI